MLIAKTERVLTATWIQVVRKIPLLNHIAEDLLNIIMEKLKKKNKRNQDKFLVRRHFITARGLLHPYAVGNNPFAAIKNSSYSKDMYFVSKGIFPQPQENNLKMISCHLKVRILLSSASKLIRVCIFNKKLSVV